MISLYSYRGLMGTFHILFSFGSVINLPFYQYRALSSSTNADDKTLLFEIVFVIVWIGAAVISINGSLLGGKM